MAGHVIPLPSDRHLDADSLLPWYLTGSLDAAERARVEAHLAGCADCQAELKVEHALRAQIADLNLDVEQDWATLKARLEGDSSRRARAGGWRAWLGAALPGQADGKRRAGARGSAWAWAPALAMLLLLAGMLTTNTVRPARYHLLGAAQAPAAANGVVMFRPRTSEADVRRILKSNHARMVDGPTSAGVWLIRVPGEDRAARLARLRGEAEIALAEPVDSGASR